MSGGDSPQQDHYAEDKQLEISRDMWEDYKKRYRPIEMQAIENVTTKRDENLRTELAQERARTSEAIDASAGAEARNLGRYGVNMTPQQQEARSRSYGITKALATADTANNVRAIEDQRNLDTMRTLVNTGRGVQLGATNQLGQAAGLEVGQNALAQQIAAQNKAANDQMIGTGIGIGLMAMAAFSSRDYKEDIKPVDRQKLLRDIERIDIKTFRYKEGMAIPGQHVGPLAEQVPEIFVGADGKTINMYNMVGALVVAVQELQRDNRELRRKLNAAE